MIKSLKNTSELSKVLVETRSIEITSENSKTISRLKTLIMEKGRLISDSDPHEMENKLKIAVVKTVDPSVSFWTTRVLLLDFFENTKKEEKNCFCNFKCTIS